MVEIFALKIEQGVEVKDFEKLMNYVDSEKQLRIRRFRMIEDAYRALFGNLLARYAICTKTKIKNEEIVFKSNDYGKPLLENDPNFHFNISHSGEWVVCAIDTNPVGVDIEIIKPLDMKIAERFFSDKEFSDIVLKREQEQLDYFFELWTLKESYIKACGKGLSIPLDSFTIRQDNSNITIETENELRKCFFKKYNIDSRYKMAVCSQSDKFIQIVTEIEIGMLSKFFYKV